MLTLRAQLLKKHNIAVWRNHDYVHRLERDGVMAGVVQQLGWESFAVADKRNVFDVPPTTLSDLIGQVKEKLGLPGVRYIGTPTQRCKKILLMPGASGGRNQISSLAREKPDTILCGEISEWETAEYVRDARAKGDHLALVVLGHVASEEGGSAFMANWLKDHVKGVTTTSENC